jgi:hypothetical protein
MRLFIRSDGETTIVLDEKGEDVTKFVFKVEFVHQAKKAPQATITFLATALDFIGEARVAVEAVVGADALGEKK